VTKRREAVGGAPAPGGPPDLLEDRRGPDRVLGKGLVTGGAAELAPFSGRVAFSTSSAEAGWLVLSGDGGSDGGIVDATAVRIRFAAS
jgi:hypothetical protein